MELSILTFVCILILFICIGWLFAKGAQPPTDSIRTARSVGWFSVMTTFIATQIGSSFILYTAEYAYYDGVYAILYPLGTSLGLLALGLGVGAKIQRLKLSSASDVFEKYYGSGTLKKISASLSLASLLGLLVAQAVAIKDFLYALGVTHESYFIFAWLLILFLSLKGVIKSATWSEIIQAVIICVAIAAACFFSPQSPWGSISIKSSLSEIKGELIEGMHSKISAYLFMPFLYMFLEQDAIKTCVMGKSKKDISLAAIFSGIIVFMISAIPVYYGITGKALGLTECATNFMDAVKGTANPVLSYAAACALLLTLVTGASSLIGSLASSIVKDFINSSPGKDSSQLSRISWCFTACIGIGALIASYQATDIAYLIIQSYELVVVCLVVPLVFAAFSRKSKRELKLAAFLSMLFGAIGFIGCRMYSVTFFPEVLSTILSLIGFLLGKALSSSTFSHALHGDISYLISRLKTKIQDTKHTFPI